MEGKKSFWASKTVWVNGVFAIIASLPPISDWISSNPELTTSILGIANIGLRMITKQEITLSLEKKF